MIERYQAFDADEADALCARPYALNLTHKHRPEMQAYALLSHAPVFSPTVANYYRGMLIEIPLHRSSLERRMSGTAIGELLKERYAGETFIEVHGFQPECLLDGGYLDATSTNGSNRMQLMVFGNDDQFLLVARYDNLGKGASGAAVQNLNIMLGLEETLGLNG
jgi:N-acetyl-gamma-glutamyl-phosphate reductase